MRITQVFVCVITILTIASCAPKRDEGFKAYYASLGPVKSKEFDRSQLKTKVVKSNEFYLDTIYRSMHGPISEKKIQLGTKGDIVWLTGYEVKVYDTLNRKLPMEFMCHNNLNLADERTFPWEPLHWNYINRVFTLTQGITDMSLPDGFGVPLPGDQVLDVVFQALNHNIPELDSTIYHEVTIHYFVDSEIDFPMQPLFHQNIWLVKQYQGPPGMFGDPVPSDYVENESAFMQYDDVQMPSCGIDMLANNQALKLDFYWDNKGRKYTGHWKVPPGEEYLEIDVSKLMNLGQDRKVHYLSAHLHPFCEYVELHDETRGELIYRAEVVNDAEKTGIQSISHLSSKEGIELTKGNKFVLKSKYNNTSEDTLSAMSVIYLFMAY